MKNILPFAVASLISFPTLVYSEDPAPEPTPAEGQTALEPGADYNCEADIFYIWKKSLASKSQPPSANGSAGQAAKDTEGEEPELEEVKEFFNTVGEQGVVQEEIKNRLGTKLPAMQRQANEYCKKLHQDKTYCVASKLRGSFSQYNKLDYISRRAMAEAINNDCDNLMGKCLKTEVSEIRCHINRSPEIPEKKTEEKAPEGAEKEKKK